jgi:hypothetical protein
MTRAYKGGNMTRAYIEYQGPPNRELDDRILALSARFGGEDLGSGFLFGGPGGGTRDQQFEFGKDGDPDGFAKELKGLDVRGEFGVEGFSFNVNEVDEDL